MSIEWCELSAARLTKSNVRHRLKLAARVVDPSGKSTTTPALLVVVVVVGVVVVVAVVVVVTVVMVVAVVVQHSCQAGSSVQSLTLN